jgi:hypothetical protein
MSDRARWDVLVERDWGDAWDSLTEAPEWMPRAKTAQITLHPVVAGLIVCTPVGSTGCGPIGISP